MDMLIGEKVLDNIPYNTTVSGCFRIPEKDIDILKNRVTFVQYLKAIENHGHNGVFITRSKEQVFIEFKDKFKAINFHYGTTLYNFMLLLFNFFSLEDRRIDMNSELKGREIIESIPMNGAVIGFFETNYMSYGIRENLSKWNMLKSAIEYCGDLKIDRNDSSMKIHLLNDRIDFEVRYDSKMYADFTCLMGYFHILTKVKEEKNGTGFTTGLEDMYEKGLDVFNNLPSDTRIKGFFKVSDISSALRTNIERNLERFAGTDDIVSCILNNKDNDVIIYKNNKSVFIDCPMLQKKKEVHHNTDLWQEFIRMFSVFTLIKDLGPDKEIEQGNKEVLVKHVSDAELYNAMSTIHHYCLAHCHNNCKGCALRSNGNCFTKEHDVPGEWTLCSPDYHVFR